VTRSIAAYNGREAAADDAGFCAHSGAANNMTLYNCVAYGNYGRGVSVAGSGTVIVKNTIGYGTVVETVSDAHIDATFSGTFTHTNNVFGGYYSAAWTPHATEKTGDPLFRSSSDFRLRSGSPAINAGVDVGLTTDYTGRSIIGLPDIGAYEHVPSGGIYNFSLGLGL
jgi:parallel beta-helix repeat protein